MPSRGAVASRHAEDLHGWSFFSEAFDVSSDGSTVVGAGDSALGSGAFIREAVNGMRSLQDVLADDFALDLTGWTLEKAVGVSDDRLTFVGRGISPDGDAALDDFSVLLECLTGPGGSVSTGCETADLDADGDIDFVDFAIFQLAFTGE